MAEKKRPSTTGRKPVRRSPKNVIRLGDGHEEFQVEGKSFKLTGQSSDTGLQIQASRGNLRLRVDSDKCDWRISTDLADLQSRLSFEPGNWSFKGRAGGFTGAVSSDKCDWRIRAIEDMVSNPADITLTRDGLDGSLNIDASLPSMHVMSSSSKCDFNFKLRPQWASDPPDFNIRGDAVLQQVNLSANMPGFSMRAYSSKCDWNIRTKADLVSNPAEIFIEKDLGSEQINLRANLPNIRTSMSSSKCDWNIISQRGIFE